MARKKTRRKAGQRKKVSTRRKTGRKKSSRRASAAGQWSLDNPAHTSTFGFMMDRQRLQTTFSEAEDYPVRNLRYWNESSDSATRTNAKSLAGQIDGYFIDQLGAKYHPGHGFASAITFVAEFLTVGSNTVGGLGKALDSIYKMRGEQGL